MHKSDIPSSLQPALKLHAILFMFRIESFIHLHLPIQQKQQSHQTS